jgi:hemoglobin
MSATEMMRAVQPDRLQQPSLYDRLGGAGGIAAIVDDIVDAHLANPVIRTRYLALEDSPEHRRKIQQHLCDFLCAGSGGPEQYKGKNMVDAHRGMNVSEAEYMAALDDIMAVLERHRIDEATRKDVLAIGYGLKNEILHL